MIYKMTYLAKYSNLQMTQTYSERLLMLQINKVYRMIYINSLNNQKNGKCYSISGSVNVYPYDMETWTKNIKWGMLY